MYAKYSKQEKLDMIMECRNSDSSEQWKPSNPKRVIIGKRDKDNPSMMNPSENYLKYFLNDWNSTRDYRENFIPLMIQRIKTVRKETRRYCWNRSLC